jgi:hypothetical protein
VPWCSVADFEVFALNEADADDIAVDAPPN